MGNFIADKSFKVPLAKEGIKVIEAYNSIIKKEKVDWIISGPETEIDTLLQFKKELKCPIFHLPKSTFDVFTNKENLFKAASILRIKTPVSVELSRNHASKITTNKIVFKPKNGRGSNGVYIADASKSENYLEILSAVSSNYLMQEYIDGNEYTVDTLHDFNGNLLNAVVRERLSVESGISVVSKTVINENLTSIIEKISSAYQFYGANCFQFILSKLDNEYYLTDVNPRFGGGSILSIKASKNFAKNILHLLRDEQNKVVQSLNDYDELSMYRGYSEYYK